MDGRDVNIGKLRAIAGLDCREYDKHLSPEPCGYCRSCLARELLARLDSADAARGAGDGPLLTCPWCGVYQSGRIANAQISHLIECGDKIMSARLDAARGETAGPARPHVHLGDGDCDCYYAHLKPARPSAPSLESVLRSVPKRKVYGFDEHGPSSWEEPDYEAMARAVVALHAESS